MNSRHLYNIKGCIEKYQDFETARSWLVKGQSELHPEDFGTLLDEIVRWFVETKSLRAYIKRIVSLLVQFLPNIEDELSEMLLAQQQYENAKQEELTRKLLQQQKANEQRARLEAERKEREKERFAALKKQREEEERLRKHMAEVRRKKIEQQKQEAEEIAKRKRHILRELYICFQSDFINCESFYQEKCASRINYNEFSAARRDFVRRWFEKNMPTVNGSEQHLPDEEQLEAIASQYKQIQIIARAGSGKTSTTVNRALFLIKHCSIPAENLLLLAFNRKASLEIRKRLLVALIPNGVIMYDQQRDAAKARSYAYKHNPIQFEETLINKISTELGLTIPHVMTFHALAHSIVHPEEELLYDGGDGEPQKLSRATQDIIDSYLRAPDMRDEVRKLMLEHFKLDWERIASGGYDKTREELLAFRRSLPHESLRGEFVKSYGEKLIANFLFEHEIPYKYEKNHRWNGYNYRPDFTVYSKEGKNLVIEYFGLQGDPDYDKMSQEKRQYWYGQNKYLFLEFSPVDVASAGEEGFYEVLKKALEKYGVGCIRLSDDAIWTQVKDRAIDRFTRAMVNFVGRCRQQCLSPSGLRKLIRTYIPTNMVEFRFLRLATNIFADYVERLEATGEEDFNGLLLRASVAVAAGQTRFSRKSGSGDIRSLSHIFVDEFQDFSQLFFSLIQAIRLQNTSVNLFCVGDDWQAINGFAGSELRYFQKFDKYLGEHRCMYIATNYRSCRSIVELGNALMYGEGEPAQVKKNDLGQVLLCHVDCFAPSILEEQQYAGDLLTPAILRLLDSSLQQKGRVVLLSRKNTIPWYISYPEGKGSKSKGLDRYLFYLRSLLPKIHRSRISISTAHKYKGLERATVILLDVVSRSYPLIHPDSIFTRILGDSPAKLVQEERRLLYVAMTRAIDTLYILTDGQKLSPFLEDIAKRFRIPEVDWRQYPPMDMEQEFLLVVVGNQQGRGGNPTFCIKDELKASGYTWRSEMKCWTRSAQAKGFSIKVIASEIWARSGDGLEVRILDGKDVCLACYHVNGGRWSRVDAASVRIN